MDDLKNFYRHLETLQLPLPEVFEMGFFTDVPKGWYIIVADVKNSTAAVNAGKHNDVNLVAASSIIAAVNVAKKNNVDIPFFFTGDGATIIVPEHLLTDVLAGLSVHNKNSINNFGLEMHLGCISINDIQNAGHYLKIAKFQFGKNLCKPLVIGDGIMYAEKVIKLSEPDLLKKTEDPDILNLDGLECRWDKVKPPIEENEIVCYLVEALDPLKQMEVYGRVLQKIEEIFGTIEERNPLSIERLKLLVNFRKMRGEMMAKFGKWKKRYFSSTFIKTFIGRFLIRYNLKINNIAAQEYLKQLINNADVLTIDGRINTIISGKKEQRLLFLSYLLQQETDGQLVYGHFVSKESIMTCFIENRDAKHIHFVDGADGGYTEASKELKMKLKDPLQSIQF